MNAYDTKVLRGGSPAEPPVIPPIPSTASRALASLAASVDEAVSVAKAVASARATTNRLGQDLDEITEMLATLGLRPRPPKSELRALLEADAGLAALRAGKAASCALSIDTKALTSGNLGQPKEHMGVFGAGTSAGRLYGALTVVPTDAGAVELARVATPTAAPVAEGAPAPDADPSAAPVLLPLRTIGVMVTTSKQVLEDIPLLEQSIAALLRDALIPAVEAELVAGDGTAPHLAGFASQATSQPAQSGETKLDAIGRAAGTCASVAAPDFVAMNFATAWALMQEKDLRGAYYFDPSAQAGRIWGLRLITTPGVPANKFLLGTLSPAASVIRQKGSLSVEMSTEHADNFQKGLVSIRGEVRLALCVMRPGAFVYGEFNA
jgi:HK97 family phage major capsid protein